MLAQRLRLRQAILGGRVGERRRGAQLLLLLLVPGVALQALLREQGARADADADARGDAEREVPVLKRCFVWSSCKFSHK